MSTTKLYCRFCAEEKPCTEITNLTSEENQQSLIDKLTFLGFVYVDFSNKILPETVCTTCYELTITSYEFFMKVKRSQVVLSEMCKLENHVDLLPKYDTVKAESDGEDYLQDDYISSFEDESLVKEEKYVNSEMEVYIKGNQSESIPTDNVPLKSKKKLTWASYPWQCAVCDLKQDSLQALRDHCCSDHLKCFAFKCGDCDEKMHSYDEFVAHVRGHRKVLRNYCEHCDIMLEDRSHLDSHSERCALCGALFPDPASLQAHVEAYAAPIGPHYPETSELTTEIRTWADYPSICQYCKLKVIDKHVLTEHCLDVHKRCFANQCVDCGVKMDCFKTFVEHVKKHRPYLKNICPYCSKDITDDPAHISEHSSAHICPLCGVTFQLKRHLRAHESVTKLSFIKPPKKRRKGPPTGKDCTCEVCGMIMKTPASLKGHLHTHTDRKRNYTCENCGKAYYTKGSLDVHRKIHDSTIREACKICHKTFLTIPRLKKHVKTHNLEMPYQCDNCKRFFNSKDRLREHVKVHLDILPFQCQYCTKRFRHKSIMKTHENQHTGARPYSCNLCCMDFANWSNCNKHMKRKHGTTLAKNVMTPHGKLALNPKTGKPDQLFMDHQVKEWSEKMLMSREGKKNMGQVT